MSLREFERLPDDDLRHELDEGALIAMPPASDEHGSIGAEIARRLGNHTREHSLGKVYNADTGFVLEGETVRAPDVAFVRKERAAPRKTFFPGPPDLAVEIVSASESMPQLMRRVNQYLRAGTHTVWVVYPETRQVHVFEKDRDRILEAADTLEAPELLPGLTLRVSELFE